MRLAETDAEVAVRRSAGWLTLSAMAVGALNFLYALVLTWFLPLYEYPAFAGSQAVLVVCGTVAAASVPWMLSQRIAQGSSPSMRQDAINLAVVFTIAEGLLGATIVGIVAGGLSRGLGALPLAAGAAAFAIFAAVTSTGYLKGRQQFGRVASLMIAEVVIKIISGLVLVWAGAGAVGVIAGIGVGALAVVMMAAPPFLRELRPALRWMKDRQLWSILFGLTGVQAGVVALINLDVIMGSLISSANDALAAYQVSVILSRVPFFLASALSIAVFTKLASGATKVNGVIGATVTILAAVVVPVTMSIFTLPLPVISLLLPHAYPGLVESFLPFTAPAGALAALSNLMTTFFQAQGRFRSCCLLLALGLVIETAAILVGLHTLGIYGLAYASLGSQLVMALLLLLASGRIWGRAVVPRVWLLLPTAASMPLAYMRQMPALWILYAFCLCGAVGWFALFRSRTDPSLHETRRAISPASTAKTTESARRPTVYLLTSSPIAPPWDGGDTNLARTLLTADMGVDFTFIGDQSDTTPWPSGHDRRALRFRTTVPTTREQLRLFYWLCRDYPDVDLVHTIITFGKSRFKEAALGALPVVRSGQLVITCPNGHHLPLNMLRRARAVVALSRMTEGRLLQMGLRDVRRIAPGIDLDWFRPAPPSPAKQALGLNNHEPTILFAGHYEGGGLESALEVLQRLKERVPSLRLLTAMRPRPWRSDARRRAELEARVGALGLADSIVELGSAANIWAAIQASVAVLFQPSSLGIKMDLPMVLLEALACGRPIVVSPTESLGELADGSRAVIVGGRGSLAAIDHLERLVTDEPYAAACGIAARRLAERRYSAAGMVAAYADLYDSLVRELNGAVFQGPAVGSHWPSPDGQFATGLLGDGVDGGRGAGR